MQSFLWNSRACLVVKYWLEVRRCKERAVQDLTPAGSVAFSPYILAEAEQVIQNENMQK